MNNIIEWRLGLDLSGTLFYPVNGLAVNDKRFYVKKIMVGEPAVAVITLQLMGFYLWNRECEWENG